MSELDEIKQKLKKILPEKRFKHILGVEETAVKLGRIYNADISRLQIAALLHDSAKFMKTEKLLSFCSDNGIILSGDDIMAKGIIHAKAGAFIARTGYGIEDKEILDAISFHSTGHPDMGKFEKIIFAADYLDPGRGLEENKDLMTLVCDHFEKGIYEIIRLKIIYVLEKKDYLHPLSVQFYNHQMKLLHGIA